MAKDYYALATSDEPIAPDIPESKPVDFGTRLLASFKNSKSGVENFLKSKYGPNKVARDDKGELIVATGTDSFVTIDPEGIDIGPQLQKQFGENNVIKNQKGEFVIAPKTGYTRFDPKGLDLGDLADIAPELAQIGAGALTAAATGGASLPVSLLALAAEGAGTEGLRQIVGAALPGEEDLSTVDRVAKIGINALAEPAGALIGTGIGRGAKAVKELVPKVSSGIVKTIGGVTSQKAEEAAKISSSLGTPLSVGEVSQKPSTLLAEGFLRRSPFTSSIVREADQKKLEGLGKLAKAATERLGTKTSEEASQAAVKAHINFIEELGNARAKIAAKDFGAVKSLSGDERIFDVSTTINAIENLADEYKTVLGDTQSSSTVRFLNRAKNRLVKRAQEGDPVSPGLTVDEFRNEISNWSKKAYDPRGIIEGVTSPKVEKRVATVIFSALQNDLEAAASSPGASQEVASALSKARNTYRELSQEIANIADNPLASSGVNPEKLAQKFANGSVSNEKITGVMNFLDKTSPDVADNFRSGVLQEIIKKSSKDEVISPAKFFTIADKNKDKFAAVFKGNPDALSAFNELKAASKVLANKYGEGSPTQPLLSVEGVINAVAKTAAAAPALIGVGAYSQSGQVSDVAAPIGLTVATALSSRALARALINPRVARSYAEIFRAAAKPELYSGSAGRKALKQAVATIITQSQLDAINNGETRSQGQ